MYKLCKTEQSANRQRELEQGLLAAMATTHFDEISISDLCDRLQVPRKSFYRYFSGKEGALHALIDHTLMQYEMKSIYYPGQSGSAMAQELLNYFRFWQDQKPLLDALQRSDLSNVLIARTIDYALAEAPRQKGQRSGTMGEREYAILFGISGLMTMVVRWHHAGYRESAQQMARIAEQVLSRPLVQR